MEGKGSENPWANQGDNLQQPENPPKRLGGNAGGSSKLSRKVSEKFERTKVVAASGVKKVKDGASVGVNWVKLKYHTHKLGQKK
ncbi:hypothetical protein RJ640_029489 [Escallonia rubra]|uniref:Uncharacterized protein n=1 Tax=Escallonia rubra TaxID=112253 RepID=A0AA88RYT1_9ASTE|nr:hypothetical protein RJ640_029489 [Escallonia rubra]